MLRTYGLPWGFAGDSTLDLDGCGAVDRYLHDHVRRGLTIADDPQHDFSAGHVAIGGGQESGDCHKGLGIGVLGSDDDTLHRVMWGVPLSFASNRLSISIQAG
jgi:hypothetical protein